MIVMYYEMPTIGGYLAGESVDVLLGVVSGLLQHHLSRVR